VISYKNINFLPSPIDGPGQSDKIWGDQFIEVLLYYYISWRIVMMVNL
jgi:hypothetical protein